VQLLAADLYALQQLHLEGRKGVDMTEGVAIDSDRQ
jgi:hypothetical protein